MCFPRAPRKAAPACGLSAWPHHRVARPPGPRLRMAALWHRSLRAERWRGGDSVRLAIPYEQYQLARSRAITPARWRKHADARPVDTAIRYRSIRMLDCITLARADRGRRIRARERYRPGPDLRPRSDGVDIDDRGSSRLSGPHRHVATTKTSQRIAEARSTADDGGRIVMWPGCSCGHMAMWPHEDARRFARMDPQGHIGMWPTLKATQRTPRDRSTAAAESRAERDCA